MAFEPMVSDSWLLVIGVGLLLVLGWWFLEEREDADDVGETVDAVGSRAEDATGGFLDSSVALILSAIGIVMTLGAAAGDLVGGLLGMVLQDPLPWTSALTGVLGWLGLEGQVGPVGYVAGVASLLLVGVGLRNLSISVKNRSRRR